MLALNIARAYVDVGRLTEQAAWDRKLVEDSRTVHQVTSRRVQAGLEPTAARDRTLAAWQQAEHRLMQTDMDLDRARARFDSLLGGTYLMEHPTGLTGLILPPAPDLSDTSRILSRPDVVQAHLAWLASRGEAKASSRARLPSLALVLSAAGDGDRVDTPDSWWAWAGPVVSLPVWNPGLKARSRQAQNLETAAEAALQAVSLRAVEEIDRAWADRARSEDMIGHMQSRYQALLSIAQSAERKHRAGLLRNDERRLARLDSTRAARAETAWRAAALHAHLTLIAALGG
jgi:outer membrane protein TolC